MACLNSSSVCSVQRSTALRTRACQNQLDSGMARSSESRLTASSSPAYVVQRIPKCCLVGHQPRVSAHHAHPIRDSFVSTLRVYVWPSALQEVSQLVPSLKLGVLGLDGIERKVRTKEAKPSEPPEFSGLDVLSIALEQGLEPLWNPARRHCRLLGVARSERPQPSQVAVHQGPGRERMQAPPHTHRPWRSGLGVTLERIRQPPLPPFVERAAVQTQLLEVRTLPG